MLEVSGAISAEPCSAAVGAWWAWHRGQQSADSLQATLASVTAESDAQASRINELEQLLAEQQARLDSARHDLTGR